MIKIVHWSSCKVPVIIFYIYCSVHRNILWNDQQMQQCAVRFISCKSTLHVSGGTHAHHQEYRSNCIYSHWYNYWSGLVRTKLHWEAVPGTI